MPRLTEEELATLAKLMPETAARFRAEQEALDEQIHADEDDEPVQIELQPPPVLKIEGDGERDQDPVFDGPVRRKRYIPVI